MIVIAEGGRLCSSGVSWCERQAPSGWARSWSGCDSAVRPPLHLSGATVCWCGWEAQCRTVVLAAPGVTLRSDTSTYSRCMFFLWFVSLDLLCSFCELFFSFFCELFNSVWHLFFFHGDLIAFTFITLLQVCDCARRSIGTCWPSGAVVGSLPSLVAPST
jgi:hypothetical protein